MRIAVINGNSTASHTKSIDLIAQRSAGSGTVVETFQSQSAPAAVESFTAILRSGQAVVELIDSVQDHFDAIVIACFSDPGLFAARERSRIPVVGTAEAAMHMARMLGRTFSIVIGRYDRHALVHETVRLHGFTDACTSIRGIGIPVLADHADSTRLRSRLLDASRSALENDNAEAICLGCAAYGEYAESLTEELGAPVLDGVACAVRFAEAIARAGLQVSRRGAFHRADQNGALTQP